MELGFILVFGCVRNYFRARKSNLNAALWSFLTLVSIFVSFIMGSFIVMLIMIMKDPGFMKQIEANPGDQEFLMEYLKNTQNLVIIEIFLLVCGIGGYLFIRHLLIKREIPEKNTEE